MATLQSDPLIYVNARSYFLAILLAIFLQIVTAGSAFSDGGHGGAPIAGPVVRGPGPDCATRSDAEKALKRHGESRVASGVTSRGDLIELWVDDQDGSWTIVISTHPEFVCTPAYGDGWRERAPEQTGERS